MMQPDEAPPRLTGDKARSGLDVPGFLVKALTLVLGAVVLVGAFMFSVLVFAAAAILGTMIGGYVWWKTRELRKQMRERPPGGNVIEGVVIREEVTRDKIQQ